MFPDFPDDNKNDDFLNEFRQKIAEQSNISFEERRNELNKSKSVFIGAVAGVALAGVVGWFILSPRYVHDENVELPVIRRPQTAVKMQPTEPGGMEILNQDKSVYDILDKSKTDKKVVENLLPPPEEPKLPVIAPSETTPPASVEDILEKANAETQDMSVAQKAEEIINVAAAPKAAPVQEEKTEDQVKPLSQVVEATPPAPKKAEIKIPAKETIKISQDEVKSVYTAQIKNGKVTSQQSQPSQIASGVWQVQLMSSNNKNAVEKSWKTLSSKYNVLINQPYEIETADLGAKGIYYRLKAGAFATRDGADELCKDIKALGGTCIVKKK